MIKLTQISLFSLALFCATALNGQIKSSSQWSGVPCTDCSSVGNSNNQKGPGNSVQNGNGTIATSYTVSQCGLGFTSASVRLNQRAFTGMTVQKGVVQPAAMIVAGIPPCFTIVKAFLYVGGSGNGVAITANLINPALAAASYPMTMIGTHTDKCWGYVGTYNYRADVTASISGNGTYTLSGIPCLGAQPNDMDGATLVIIYSDPSQTFTGHMVIGDGCREVSGGAITNTITGFNVCGAANSTQNFVIVSDLQAIAQTPINFNSATSNYTYAAASNQVWDYIQQPGAPATAGQTSAIYGFSNSSDCYNFVAAGLYYRTACNVCSSPNLTITAVTSSSCSAGSATATVAGGTGPYTYTWSPTGGNAASVTGVATGNYTVSVKDATGCQIGTATVAINAASGPTITCASATVCAGTPANLSAAGALTYTWTPSASLNTASGPNVIASPAATTIYSVSGTNATGCVATITTSVLVNTIPIVVVNNPGTCVNQTINLTSTGGGTYSWTGPMAFTSALQNPSIPAAVGGMSGPYTVLVTSAAGCTISAVSNVTVFPLPNPNITSNSPVCSGGTLNLFGTGGANYAWSGPGYTGVAQNPVVPNANIAMSGVYTLLVSSGTCTASTTYTVLINPLPVFSFAGSNVLCNGQSNGTSTVNVTVGTGPFSYQWTTSPMQSTPVASNIPAGTYSCTVTDANGCSSVATTQITQPTQFSVSISSATLSTCANVPININAIGAGGTGPYTYNWVSGPTGSAYSVNEPTSGNYMYVVNAVDAFNCPATSNINLTFFPLPNVTASSAVVCAGQNASLIASGATTYIWQPGNITGSTYPYNGNNSINVSVIGTANGCSNTATTTINVNPNPTANINTGTANGCVPTCVDFSAANSSAGITSYAWILNGAGITGSVNGAYCFKESASYTLGLTVVDGNGCTGTITPVNIEIHPQPIADFNHAPIKPIINIDGEVTFTDASYNANIVSWNWYFMNTAQYTSVSQNPTFLYTDPGTYVVALVVKSDKGCYDTLLRPVVVGEDFGIYVPNAFTPNDDGLNDIFQPKGYGVTEYELNIFDRWGEKVYSTKEFSEGWNGKFKGRKGDILEEGTYTWLINCTSVFGKSHELKGHITLIK